ncbi:MAG: hypothetical protein AAGM38_07495 [Pseudomonadota bacterium]
MTATAADRSHADRRKAAIEALKSATAARSDPESAERAVKDALSLAPEEYDVQLGAYRFYFYNHRYAEALPHAEAILGLAARDLNLPADWRAVAPVDARFSAIERRPGLYLQALLAWGYCQLRIGQSASGEGDAAQALGRAAIAKVAALDPTDRFGAAAILAAIETGADEA